ncbi:hypothetical protein K0A96_02665, partial [Patescibacteria group bacterium]|nr:hypothetical protein [Patescibacteria group bacterium]
QCWMCKQFPIAKDVPLPPDPNMFAYCTVGNGRKRAGTQVCHERGSSIDTDRIRLSKQPHKRLETKADVTGTTYRANDTGLKEAYLRCIESATKQGLIKIGKANITKGELLELERVGLVEFRHYGTATRPFIPKIKKQRKEFFGE